MRRRWAVVALGVVALLMWGWAQEEKAAVLPASAGQERMLIWVELDNKRLTVYENGEGLAVFPIASGAGDTPSPIGTFRVTSRFMTDFSGFGTRFLGLNVPWGSYGLHGTNKPNSIGKNASHGCIRMNVSDAETLYAMVPTGTRVVIEGGPYGPLNWGLRTLREGDRGADVRQLQLRLIQKGFLYGGADGVFGASTRRAVVAARKALGFSPGDQADRALLLALGCMEFE
ncbi:MAG: L,D-transpeptidase family protein [Clostridia bacterium]|nr:L,D-transpeptidase family protein [Clostridia bacterium]